MTTTDLSLTCDELLLLRGLLIFGTMGDDDDPDTALAGSVLAKVERVLAEAYPEHGIA